MTTTATPPAAARTSRSRSTGGTGTGRPATTGTATTGTAKSGPATTGTGTVKSGPTTTGTIEQPAPPANAAANVSEERVHAALTDGSDLTVAALAEAIGLGRSTVSKALARLEAAGRAVRTTSGSAGRARQPDRWNPPGPATVAAPTPAQPQTHTQPDPDPQPDPALQPEAKHGSEPVQQLAAGAAGQAAGDDQPAAGQRPAGSRRPRGRRPSTADAPAAADTATAAASGDGGDERRNPKTGTARLAPGALTQLVADHFGRHPGVPLTSGEVGRALGRSGGAVRNAADKLVGDGALRLLDGTPRRYTTTD